MKIPVRVPITGALDSNILSSILSEILWICLRAMEDDRVCMKNGIAVRNPKNGSSSTIVIRMNPLMK